MFKRPTTIAIGIILFSLENSKSSKIIILVPSFLTEDITFDTKLSSEAFKEFV